MGYVRTEKDREKGTMLFWPMACRHFSEGDRVIAFHKGEKYPGVVVEVRKIIDRFVKYPDPEITVRTDREVSNSKGLLDGYGLRGPSSCFCFEGETSEQEKLYSLFGDSVELPISEEEQKEYD